MLELDGSQIKVLRLGLQSAFVRPDAFDVFLREELDKHLNFYAGGEDPFPIAAFKLIEGAKAEGWVDALVAKAYQARPRNRNIADIAKALRVTIDTENLEPAGPVQHEPPLWQSLNPYRGLSALREQEANFLFGRDEDIARFIATLAENPSKLFLALGASGVGKSSLILAGAFAALDRQRLRGGTPWPAQLSQSRTWPRLTLTPGPEPLRSLAVAFLRQWLDPLKVEFREEANRWRKLFFEGDSLDGLIEALDAFLLRKKGDRPARYLLYIDQGEELYTRGGREPNQDNTAKETQAQKEARRFSELVADAARDPRLVAIMSARSDFLGRLQADAPLQAVKQQIDIAPLLPEGLSDVVRGPAASLEVTFEPGLDDALIANTREQVGGLPLLSDTLAILWKEMQERKETREGVDGMLRWSRPLKDGVNVATKLVERADRFVKAHQDQEALVRRLFCVRLASVPRQGAATRRMAFLDEVTDPAECVLLAELAGPEQRIVVMGERDGKATAELAHEALFTAWQTFRNWIISKRDFYAWKTLIEADREDWKKNDKAGAALLMGWHLTRAKLFLETDRDDIPEVDRTFIEASITADDESRRKKQEAVFFVRTVGGLAVALFLVFLPHKVAFWAPRVSVEFIQVVALFAGLGAFAWLLSKWQVGLVSVFVVLLSVGLVYFNAPPPNHDYSFKQRMELSAMSLYERINPSLCSNPEVTRKVINLVPQNAPGLLFTSGKLEYIVPAGGNNCAALLTVSDEAFTTMYSAEEVNGKIVVKVAMVGGFPATELTENGRQWLCRYKAWKSAACSR